MYKASIEAGDREMEILVAFHTYLGGSGILSKKMWKV